MIPFYYQGWGNTVGEVGSTERAQSMRVTSTFFPVLKVTPILGRNFLWEEMEPGSHQKVSLGNEYWQDRYGGDETVLGQDLRVDGVPFTIVGVLPENFRLAGQSQPRDFFLPIPFRPEERTIDGWHSNNYSQMARLAPGVSLTQAQDRMDVVTRAIAEEISSEEGTWLTQLVPLLEDRVGESRNALWVLMAAVVLVLLRDSITWR